MDPKKKLALKSILSALKGKRARHTELITVYVPAGFNMNLIISQLASELGTSENIKSSTTRKNVQTALGKMIQHLKGYKQTPANGLAVFSGNVSEREGGQDFQLWAIEPPEPLSIRLYRCDQVFYLAPLEKMLEPKYSYGIIVIDRQEANIGLLRGTSVTEIYGEDSCIPGKYRTGGQSAARFARVREGMAHDFYKKIGDLANKEFSSKPEIKGIIIGGPGPTKDEFVNGIYLAYDVKQKIIAVKDVGYTGLQGLHELAQKSEDILAKEELIIEKKCVEHFFDVLNKRPSYSAYGKDSVERAVELGAVEKLLISDSFDQKEGERLAARVEEFGGEWIFISNDTREGAQLASLGGIGAILRFAVE